MHDGLSSLSGPPSGYKAFAPVQSIGILRMMQTLYRCVRQCMQSLHPACSVMACTLLQLEDDLLYKLSSAEGDMTEDLALIESLEESKRVADEISEKVAEAKTTEEQINEARNKVCY